MPKTDTKRWFEAIPNPKNPPHHSVVVTYCAQVLISGLAKSKAEKIATDLNGVIRAANFKPKSHGGRSRRKGHQFERDVAIMLRDLFPDVRRHLEYQDQETNGVDLVGTESFKFQCKKLKSYAPVSTIKEIEYDPTFEIPVVITAGDNEPPMAILKFDDLITLIRNSRLV